MQTLSVEELKERLTDAVMGPLEAEINTLLETGSVNDVSSIVQSLTAVISTLQSTHIKGWLSNLSDLCTIQPERICAVYSPAVSDFSLQIDV